MLRFAVSVVRDTALAAALFMTALCSSVAAPLTLDVIAPHRVGPPGSYEFSGTITNNTGTALLATDLFFDFANFDPSVASLSQVLGVPDFLIPDGTTSSEVPLFDLIIDGNAGPGKYVADAVLQDANGNQSDSVQVSVTVGSAVPEPPVALLLLAGGIATCTRRRTK